MKKGTQAIITAGRDAGKKVEIIEILDNSFVMIQGKKVKKRKINKKHLLEVG